MCEKLNTIPVSYVLGTKGSICLEGRTRMIQMLHPVAIAVPACRDVKVALDLIPLQTTINPTRINLFPPPKLRPLWELLIRIAPQLTKHMARMRILLLGR